MTEDIKTQAGVISQHVAGYVGTRAIAIGLRHGIPQKLAEGPATAERLADSLSLDPFYTGVWCMNALAAGVLEREGDEFRLAAHMETLLLDRDHPAHVGALVSLIQESDIFDRFDERLPSGARTWWDRTQPSFIEGVSGTGRVFYSRLVATLDQVPGLTELIGSRGSDARILDTACGAGVGLVKLGAAFPEAHLVGVDGDAFSLDLAQKNLADAGLSDRSEVVHSPLEEMAFDAEFDLVTNNISMHECRDIDEVTRRVHAALRPGGIFVISDFPFPEDDDALRTPPGRIMAGIQAFEAQIDDQLLPKSAYLDLLPKHGFADVGSIDIAPVHAVTYGTK